MANEDVGADDVILSLLNGRWTEDGGRSEDGGGYYRRRWPAAAQARAERLENGGKNIVRNGGSLFSLLLRYAAIDNALRSSPSSILHSMHGNGNGERASIIVIVPQTSTDPITY